MSATMSSPWSPDPLLNESTFLHAREGYRPSRMANIEEMRLEQWAERVAAQPELVSARELAGLPETALTSLDEQFRESPQLNRKGLVALAGPAGGASAAVGMAGLGLIQGLAGAPMTSAPVLTALCAIAILLGMVGGTFAGWKAYQDVPLRAAYGRVGLYIGVLNEQHPWLYKVLLLMRDPGAEAYRQRVLKERGALRGVDYLMMKEIAAVSESMVLTQTARSVRERVQGANGRVPALSKREALVEAGWASSGAIAAPADKEPRSASKAA